MLRTWRARATVLVAAIAIALAAAGAAQAAMLSGTVTWQRYSAPPAALAGATVYVSDARTGYAERVQTDLLGGYSFLLPDGSYEVEVVADGYESVRRAAVAVSRPAQLDATLVPTGFGLVHGTIRRADGSPEPWAQVMVWSGGSLWAGNTDDAGRYSIAVPQGWYQWELIGGTNGVDSWRYTPADSFALGSEHVIDLRSPASTTVTVRVLGDRDAPIADAGVVVGRVTRPWRTDDGLDGQVTTFEREGATDAAGRFVANVFDQSDPHPTYGNVRIAPTRASGYDETSARLPAVAGPTELMIRPLRVGHLSLHVREADGARALVVARLNGRLHRFVDVGDYDLSGALGTSTLVVEGYGSGSSVDWSYTSDPFELAASQDETLRLPARQELEVNVVDELGEPVAGADVYVPQMTRAHTTTTTSGTLRVQGKWGVTGADGVARIPGFDGTSTEQLGSVTPPAGDLVPRSFSVVGSVITVVLQRAVVQTVSGTVVDPDDVPVAGATVSIGGVVAATTAADGSFTLERSTGTYTVVIAKESWSVRGSVYFGDAAELAVRLPPRIPLTVRVLDSGSGAPLAGASVAMPYAVLDAVSPGLSNARFESLLPTTVTDAAGEVAFEVFAGSRAYRGVPSRVQPASGSGYQETTFPYPDLSRAALVVVRLTRTDVDPPAIACDPAPSGWQSGNVAIACTASDAGSGLADPRADAAFTLATTVADGVTDAGALTGTREVCDVAGNCATAGPLGPVAVDRAAPSTALTVVPDPLVRGDWWTVSRVAVQVLASDAGAGIGTLACAVDGVTRTFAQTRTATTIAGTFYVNGEGRHLAGCSATDGLGQVGSAQRTVNLDLKNPAAPTPTADRPAEEPVSGWYRDTVTVSFADNGDPLLADGSAGSGVDPASVPAPQTYATSGTHRASGTVADVAGRVSASRSLTVKVDADAPTSTLTCPAAPVALGASATARWQDADAQSGLDGSASGTVALSTASVGTRVANHRAFDRVGHVTVSSCRYEVVHPFVWRGGLAAAPALNAIAPGVRTHTVWFSVGGDHGLGIVASGWPQVQPVNCGDRAPIGRASAASTSAPLAWDGGTGRYAIAWEAAADLPSGSCAALRLQLDDGVAREVLFAR